MTRQWAHSTPLLSNLRGMRYGEVLLAYLEGEQRVEVFNSFPIESVPRRTLARGSSPRRSPKKPRPRSAIRQRSPATGLMDRHGQGTESAAS